MYADAINRLNRVVLLSMTNAVRTTSIYYVGCASLRYSHETDSKLKQTGFLQSRNIRH